ncbi:MAG: hypothetical protein JNK49_14000, partial [Planctomycetes bacterium]|nr:hypothetical protein [Planctomycetota bacterium]
NNTVYAVAVLPNGDVVAGGLFTSAGGANIAYVARWNGTTWSALGAGVNSLVEGLVVLPNGDLLAGGHFSTAGGLPAGRVARWNGASWSAVGGAVDGSVDALGQLANGDVAVVGFFTAVGGAPSSYLARLTTSCPAAAPSFGANCSSAAGPMELVATALPWVGSTFRARCSGFLPTSLGVGVFGLASPGTPLSTLHPAGAVGCDLLASLDALQLVVPVGGSVDQQLTIPNHPVFSGIALRAQVLQLELGASANLTRLLGSNGLLLDLGAF